MTITNQGGGHVAHQPNSPIRRVLQAAALIAEFFDIRPDSFTGEDEVYLQHVEAELGWLELAHDPDDRRPTTALIRSTPDGRAQVLEATASGHR